MRALMPLMFQVAMRMPSLRCRQTNAQPAEGQLPLESGIDRPQDFVAIGAVAAFDAGIAHRYHRQLVERVNEPVVPIDPAPAADAARRWRIGGRWVVEPGAEIAKAPARSRRVAQLRDLVGEAQLRRLGLEDAYAGTQRLEQRHEFVTGPRHAAATGLERLSIEYPAGIVHDPSKRARHAMRVAHQFRAIAAVAIGGSQPRRIGDGEAAIAHA